LSILPVDMCGAVERAEDLLFVQEQLLGVELHHRVATTGADDHHRAAAAGLVPGGADGGGQPDDVEGIVEAFRRGDLLLELFQTFRGGGMRGAEALGDVVLRLDRVDRDDRRRPGQPGALDH
jgi:hypothetical protein